MKGAHEQNKHNNAKNSSKQIADHKTKPKYNEAQQTPSGHSLVNMGVLQNQDFETIGNLLNFTALFVNLLLTSGAMLGIPQGLYDENWQKVGFCVDFRDDRRIDTEILCFAALVSGTIALVIFRQNPATSDIKDPLLHHRLNSSVLANLSHGFGHLLVKYAGGMVPALEFTFDIAAMAWVLNLVVFFTTVFRAVMFRVSLLQATVMAVCAIVLQKILEVPPELSFTYSQSFIFAAGFVDQICLPSALKRSVTYFYNSVYFFPIYILHVIEFTSCSGLVKYGGHALYDSYLAISPFLFYYTVQQYQSRQTSHIKAS